MGGDARLLIAESVPQDIADSVTHLLKTITSCVNFILESREHANDACGTKAKSRKCGSSTPFNYELQNRISETIKLGPFIYMRPCPIVPCNKILSKLKRREFALNALCNSIDEIARLRWQVKWKLRFLQETIDMETSEQRIHHKLGVMR